MKHVIGMIVLTALFACSESENSNEGFDLLESQREVMENAEQIGEDMQEALEERMKEVESN